MLSACKVSFVIPPPMPSGVEHKGAQVDDGSPDA